MKPTLKSAALYMLGLAVSTLPAVIATLSYFPLWRARGAASVASGFCLLLLLLAALPIVKGAKRMLSSPSVWMLWLIVFLAFYFLGRIANEMTVIAFVGTLSNVTGAVIFKLASGARLKNEGK